MTNPITPPPEVADRLFMIEGSEEDRIIAAYRAGADQELEACCAWVDYHCSKDASLDLSADRRPSRRAWQNVRFTFSVLTATCLAPNTKPSAAHWKPSMTDRR